MRGYFEDRLNGRVRLTTLFWRDMVLIGTGINLALAVAAFVYWGVVQEAIWGGLVIYFAPVPYNLFLMASVWRTAQLHPPVQRLTAQIASLSWCLAATIA